MNGNRFVLLVEVAPGTVPAITRLRAFLKCALRSWGIECVSLRPAAEDLLTPAVTPEGTPTAGVTDDLLPF